MSSQPVQQRGTIAGAAPSGLGPALPAGLRAGAAAEEIAPAPFGASAAGLRQRVNPTAVSWMVRFADTAAVMAAGVIAFDKQSGLHWPLNLTTVFAALAVMALTVRLPNANPTLLHAIARHELLSRIAGAVLRTLLPFVAAVLIVMAVLPADPAAGAALAAWLCLWAFGAVVAIVGVRLVLAGLVVHWRDQGRLKESVAIFGTGEQAERLVEHLEASHRNAIELVGMFDDRAPGRIRSPRLRQLVCGTANDLIELSRQREIDRVVVALPHAAERRVLAVLIKLRRIPVEISLAPDMAGFNLAGNASAELGGLPLLAFYRRPLTFGQSLVKNTFDKVVAALLVLLLSPVLLAVAAAIKLDSRGPVLFRQNRHGFGHRVIGVYKFRTMYADAADPYGVSQARPNDPRITRVGRFLRRSSLDELPQLINVLHGEMSLVGPRPHAVSVSVERRRNEDIVADYALRHHLKPGITGWAQVNGYHGPVATEEALRTRVRYDLDYINNWSLWLDVRTLAQTVKLFFGRRHAY